MARTTLSDEEYDLISVLYHAGQGMEELQQYVSDAKIAGDGEVASFFEDARQSYEKLVARGKELLKQRL